MGRKPCCAKEGVNRGAWTAWEDRILTSYIDIHGEGKWRDLPQKAGLNRCGKSCRLRWLNYLRPDIKRGNISVEEEDLIIRLHNLLGNRWSLIAGRLPGRTDNEIKNYWNTIVSKRIQSQEKTQNSTKQQKNFKEKESTAEPHRVIRTRARKCTKVFLPWQLDTQMVKKNEALITRDNQSPSSSSLPEDDSSDFFLDFDISDLLISDILSLEFNQEKGSNISGDCDGINKSSDSDFPIPANGLSTFTLPNNANDEATVENWNSFHPNEDSEPELKALVSFPISEDEGFNFHPPIM